ncbi:titin-like isoform X2 [Homarus americanus]|uniref:titin-like isoform X2 n=1 Tax=Homarus americanus TaxID=6706 RepID=UPI001C470624|nr:titin-like isoform X2 [Homarus americanus]XP_042237984.1 titin-like isoform X2 [Homarus americanus]XP_042237985.1 titin-like isoform X2 [Homarus americanus]
MSGGLTAAGLLVLLLALIGLGVGIYYAYICLRARPLRSKPPTDSEHGPLITPDPDVNGNLEDAPLEASAPVDEESDTKKISLDEPDIGNGHIKSPASDIPDSTDKSTGTPKVKDDVLVPIEDKVPPAKIMHEKETAPVLNHVAPLGFIAPAAVVLQEIPPDNRPPQNVRPIVQGNPEGEGHPPVPVYIPVPLVKKPVTLSDEEDGLLMQECVPHDDSLDPEHCPKLTSLDPEHCPKLSSSLPQKESSVSSLNEEPIANTPPFKGSQSQNDPVSVPPLMAVTPPTPEPVLPIIQPENPQPTTMLDSTPPATAPQPTEPKVTVAPQPTEPKITVAPHPATDYGWKENVIPVSKAAESVPQELPIDEPSPQLMKEDVEQLQPVQDTKKSEPVNELISDEPMETVSDESISQPESDFNPLPQDSLTEESPIEAKASENIPEPVTEDDKVPETEVVESSEICEEVPEKVPQEEVVYPPVVYLETSKPLENSRAQSESSVSSEEAVPPYTESSKSDLPEEVIPVAPTPSCVDDAESQPHVIDISEPVMVVDAPIEVPVDTAPEDNNVPVESALNTPSEVQFDSDVHASEVPHESLADSPLEASSHIPLKASSDIPLEASHDIPLDVSDIPLDVSDIPLDVSDIPLEAYIPDSDEEYDLDAVDGDGSPLPVIKEEGSVDTETESTGTDSSEPEVTEYSFASGPSAPSTSVVLADEVSCTMEPEVTKYSVISEVDSPVDSDHQELESSDDEDAQKEVESSLLPETTETDDSVNEDNEIKSLNPDSSENEPDSSSKHPSPPVKDTTSASTLPAAVTTSDDLCSQTPDSTNISKQESNSGDSETESEGAEAEAELREEEVHVPTAVHQELAPVVSSDVPTSTLVNDADGCEPNPNNSHIAEVPINLLQDTPDSTEDDLSSCSSTSDLSHDDDDITTSTPKKSKIPRLVKQSES